MMIMESYFTIVERAFIRFVPKCENTLTVLTALTILLLRRLSDLGGRKSTVYLIGCGLATASRFTIARQRPTGAFYIIAKGSALLRLEQRCTYFA